MFASLSSLFTSPPQGALAFVYYCSRRLLYLFVHGGFPPTPYWCRATSVDISAFPWSSGEETPYGGDGKGMWYIRSAAVLPWGAGHLVSSGLGTWPLQALCITYVSSDFFVEEKPAMKASPLRSCKEGIYGGQQLPAMVMPRDVEVGSLSFLHWLSLGMSCPPGEFKHKESSSSSQGMRKCSVSNGGRAWWREQKLGQFGINRG